jgi:hypothetical protein
MPKYVNTNVLANETHVIAPQNAAQKPFRLSMIVEQIKPRPPVQKPIQKSFATFTGSPGARFRVGFVAGCNGLGCATAGAGIGLPQDQQTVALDELFVLQLGQIIVLSFRVYYGPP